MVQALRARSCLEANFGLEETSSLVFDFTALMPHHAHLFLPGVPMPISLFPSVKP